MQTFRQDLAGPWSQHELLFGERTTGHGEEPGELERASSPREVDATWAWQFQPRGTHCARLFVKSLVFNLADHSSI